MEQNKVALVLGATGGLGSEMAHQLREAGWTVRALRRGAYPPREFRDGITWLRGNAMIRDDVMAAARGASVIVHAVNPPGYLRWAELVLPMIDNTIAAAVDQHATIVLPGTIYNYGRDAFPVITENSPQHPTTKKGAIRVELERRMEAATGQGCRAIIVRAGDFFGPRSGNSWFSQGMVQPGKPVKSISLPGRIGVGHQWSYIPNVASTMVRLIERRNELESFSAFHMKGHWDHDGLQMGKAIQRVVSRRTGVEPKLKPFPWWLTRLASPFVPTFRELNEMRYLWQELVCMDNKRIQEVLGDEPHTPLDRAVEDTLVGLGCFSAPVPTTDAPTSTTSA